jgi:hypothetical protein
MLIRPEAIGGGIVRRTFTNGDRRMKSGDRMTSAEVRALPAASRQALIDSHFLDVYPPVPGEEPAERHVVRTPGFASKTYDVIAGSRIASGLTKEQAEALAAGPAPNDTSN